MQIKPKGGGLGEPRGSPKRGTKRALPEEPSNPLPISGGRAFLEAFVTRVIETARSTSNMADFVDAHNAALHKKHFMISVFYHRLTAMTPVNLHFVSSCQWRFDVHIFNRKGVWASIDLEGGEIRYTHKGPCKGEIASHRTCLQDAFDTLRALPIDTLLDPAHKTPVHPEHMWGERSPTFPSDPTPDWWARGGD